MNACAMIRRCMERQCGDGLYTIEGVVGRGYEVTDTPLVAPPSDAGMDGHAEFYLPGEGPQMAEVYG